MEDSILRNPKAGTYAVVAGIGFLYGLCNQAREKNEDLYRDEDISDLGETLIDTTAYTGLNLALLETVEFVTNSEILEGSDEYAVGVAFYDVGRSVLTDRTMTREIGRRVPSGDEIRKFLSAD
jgi:hypothetical protein